MRCISVIYDIPRIVTVWLCFFRRICVHDCLIYDEKNASKATLNYWDKLIGTKPQQNTVNPALWESITMTS